jgi:hypothetical protein
MAKGNPSNAIPKVVATLEGRKFSGEEWPQAYSRLFPRKS